MKQNRADTHAAIQAFSQTAMVPSEVTAVDVSHGHRVTRRVQVFAPTAKLQAKGQNLVAIGVVQRIAVRQHKPCNETVSYRSRAYTTAVQLLAATRQHGQIAHGLHWVNAVCFRED